MNKETNASIESRATEQRQASLIAHPIALRLKAATFELMRTDATAISPQPRSAHLPANPELCLNAAALKAAAFSRGSTDLFSDDILCKACSIVSNRPVPEMSGQGYRGFE